MIWKLKKIPPTIHGDLEWHGRTRKGFRVLKMIVYPETHEGDHFFTLRSAGPNYGLDIDGHFYTVEQAKAHAEGIAVAWHCGMILKVGDSEFENLA